MQQTARELWELTEGIWQTGALGYDIGHALTALAVFLCFYFLRGLMARVVFSVLDRWVADTETRIDDYLHEALSGPFRFVFIIAGVFFSLEYLALEGRAGEIATQFVQTLIAFAIFWGLYNAVKPLSLLLRNLEKILTHEMVDWLVTGIRWGVLLIGAATILQLWGIQVAPIIAGFGLFGVAVALGAQDLFKNLIGGLSILVEKRFRKGDWIRADSVVEGVVEAIGFRSTTVRRFDKAPVYVPNQKLADAAVTNFSAMTHRRIYWKIGVLYSTRVDQLREIRDNIEACLENNDDFARPPEVSRFVRIDAFSDSSIDIMIYTFTRTTHWGEWLAIKERLAYAVKEIVENAGSGFAFPSRSVYIETVSGEAPEIFVPPQSAQDG